MKTEITIYLKKRLNEEKSKYISLKKELKKQYQKDLKNLKKQKQENLEKALIKSEKKQIKVKYKQDKKYLKIKYKVDYKNIKQTYSNEKHYIKNVLKDPKKYAKIAKKNIKKEKNIALNQPPKLTVLEEIGNAVVHGLGAIFGIIALVLMIINSSTALAIISAAIYGSCMIVLFTMSCLYHSFKFGTKVKRIFRRFDYLSIYLLIGGTFAPILLVFLNNELGYIIFTIQWIIIITGISIVCVFGPGRIKWLHFTLYFIMGWLGGVIVLPELIKNNLFLFWWILSGGLIYTIGMIHFVWVVKKQLILFGTSLFCLVQSFSGLVYFYIYIKKSRLLNLFFKGSSCLLFI